MAFWTKGNLVNGTRAALCAMLAAGIISSAAPSLAQEVAPEQLALAREYVDLTDQSSIFETTIVETGIQTMRQIVTQNPEIIEQTNTVIEGVLGEYRDRKGELLDQFARVYAMRFSAEELRQIVDFYSSPTGQKLSTANSTINADLSRVLEVYTNNLRNEFLAKVRSGLRAQGIEI